MGTEDGNRVFPENVRDDCRGTQGRMPRADILMGGYVIEFQHSPISAGEFERRNKFYTRAGYKGDLGVR